MSVIRNLTTMKRKALHLLGAVSVVAIILPATSSPAWAQSELAESKGAQAAPIEGTWIFTIHRVNQGITFSALGSFTAGGVALATGTVDRTPPPPISPLYGSWKRTGHNRYAATICFFFFDEAGNALGMFKTPSSFRMEDDNHLTGSGTGLSCDVNGDNCVDINSTITFTGKRLMAEGASN